MKRFLKTICISLAALLLCSCARNEAYSANAILMDTVFGITVYGGEGTVSDLIEAGEELDTKILSRFSEDSLLYAVNSGDEGRLSGSFCGREFDLGRVLSDCEEMRIKSGGAFDVRIGALSDLWNIDAAANGDSEFTVPSPEEISKALEDKSITDLGAAGKGIYLDEALLILEEENATGAVISAGGSILLYGSKYDGSPFRVGIRNPFEDRGDGAGAFGDSYATIETSKTVFISTSGSYERYAVESGVRYHHILDPSTGYPAWITEYTSGKVCPVSVTVLAGSGFLSDALSTALFVMGPEEGMALAGEYDADVIYIMSDGQLIVSRGIIEKEPGSNIFLY